MYQDISKFYHYATIYSDIIGNQEFSYTEFADKIKGMILKYKMKRLLFKIQATHQTIYIKEIN